MCQDSTRRTGRVLLLIRRLQVRILPGAPPTTSTLTASCPRRLRLLSTSSCQRSRLGAWQKASSAAGNAWQVIVHAGRDPLTGQRRNLTGTARTKREAQALRARLLIRPTRTSSRPRTPPSPSCLSGGWRWPTWPGAPGSPTGATSSGPSCQRSATCHCGGWTRPRSTASTRSCVAVAAWAAGRWRRPPSARSTTLRSCCGLPRRRAPGAGSCVRSGGGASAPLRRAGGGLLRAALRRWLCVLL
jgi:hypothetical protein